MKPVIGLAVGRGTGAELAAVFERTLDRLTQLYSAGIDVRRSPRIYHSYFSLRTEGGIERIRRLTQEDAEHYEQFCRTQANLGTPAIFRTAINAQSLYLVRQRLQAVKVDVLSNRDASLLLIRDEAQGFYTGENDHSPGVVTRTMRFSEEITDKVISFALRRARQEWPEGEVDQVVMAYKFHLLDGALDEWVAANATRHGVDITLSQPDTVNRNLIERGLPARTVIIAGNEWADIMHVVLLDRFGSERQENRYTENVHLHPDLAGLVEYQTVHGSADDLEGRDTVNPVATVRAAAAIAERHAGCTGALRAVERALESVAKRGIRTPDLGGRHSTTAVVDALLDMLEPHERDGLPAAGVASGVGLTALMVAAARAIETHRHDALARDVYAEHFVRAAPASAGWPVRLREVPDGDANPLWGRLGRYLGLRTRVLDDFLLRSVRAGARQIVLLGAGLDSRAYRLDWPPDSVVFEIDKEEVLAFKHGVLSRLCATPKVVRRPIATDLRVDWAGALIEAGFDTTTPSAWLAEGLLLYLPSAAERCLIDTVDRLSSGASALAFEVKLGRESPEVRGNPVYSSTKHQIGVDLLALFDAEPRPDSAADLTSRGWSTSIHTPFDFTHRHGRGPRPEPNDALASNRWVFATKPAR